MTRPGFCVLSLSPASAACKSRRIDFDPERAVQPSSRRRDRVHGLIAAVTLLLSTTVHADELLAPIGGPGGGAFSARCTQGQYLAGLELSTGDDVDAVRPLCVTVGVHTTPIRDFPSRFGGSGGGRMVRLVCPPDYPTVGGMFVYFEGATRVVSTLRLFCDSIDPSSRPMPGYLGFEGDIGSPEWYLYAGSHAIQRCAPGQTASGINGRSGVWLDAVGLICSPLRVTVSAIGKKQVPGSAVAEPAARRTICDAARDARARNSPAAPNLEAQCRAYVGMP